MKTLKAGVIGLGVGERHVASYRAAPDCVVTAVCDIDEARLHEVADRHDVPKRHTDWRKLVADPEIDVVSICSYDDGHAEQCIAAFANGKHVMIEKPLALHRHEAEAVLRAQQDSGRLLTSNLILRRSPRFRELKAEIAAGAFGEVFCIESGYIHDILWKITEGWRGRMPFYCTIYGGGIHLIDLMRWLLGREVEEVAGMGNKVLTRDTAYRFDDTFVNLLRFEGGALATCLTTLGPRRTKFHALTVYGTKKTFVNDLPDAKLFHGDRPEDMTVVRTPYPGVDKGDHIPDFVAAIREGREPEVSARDVFRVMDVCFAALEAVETKRTIKVSYLI